MNRRTVVAAQGAEWTAKALASTLLATLFTLALDAFPAAAAPGDIDTLIGGSGVGPAREVSMYGQMAARDNRVYIADQRVVRLVDLDTGEATIFAGTGAFGGHRGDGGPAELAEFTYLYDVALDAAGDVFVADGGGGRIRRIDAMTGIVSTVAGGDGCDLLEDGCSVLESFMQPSRLAIDSTGALYFVHGNSVFRIDAGSAQAVHVAGNGSPWFGGDGGPATLASLVPFELALDASDTLLIADAENGRIRRVDSITGIITTVAGNDDFYQEPSEGRLATDVNLAFPYALTPARDGGFLFYGRPNTLWRVDPISHTLLRVAGNGSPYTSGDGGSARDAGVGFTADLATNDASDIFLNSLNLIRRVSGETGTISTVAGTGDRLPNDDGRAASSIQLDEPRSIAVDARGNVLVADRRMVRRMDAITGTIETLAGGIEIGSTGDGGPARAARFRELGGIAVDASGNVYISDSEARRVRRIDAVTGIIETIAGAGQGGDGGPALTAQLSHPRGLALDRSGGLLIADPGARRVRRIDLATGLISTTAGGPQYGLPVDGALATVSPLLGPSAIDVAANGDVYLSDGTENWILRIGATTGTLSVVAIASRNLWSGYASGIAVTSSGFLYVPQPGLNQVARVDLERREVVRIAGGSTATPVPGFRFAGDGGPAIDARLNGPSAVALDTSGNLLVVDTYHARVRRIDAPPLCGDGVLGSGETCDDDNRVAGDCCSPTCQLESPATICRPASGLCDVAETCSGSSSACPPDVLAASGKSCLDDGNVCTSDVCDGAGTCMHPNNSVTCDDGRFCNGSDSCSGGTCSVHAGDPCEGGSECAGSCDELIDSCNAPAGSPCQDDGSVCSDDVCDGSGACIHPAAHGGVLCRAAAGDCDVAEACDGASPVCPGDAMKPATSVCRTSSGVCDVSELCTGSDAACPSDRVASASTVCREAAGECDVAEQCTGSGRTCPVDRRVAAGTSCGPDGLLCTEDVCDGISTGCTHRAGNAGVTCRAAEDVCDVAEICDGENASCPPDVRRPASAVCRPSSGVCDLAETCDGTRAPCPHDSGVADTDADGSCDAQDPCTNVGGARDFLSPPRSTVVLSKVHTDLDPANDGLKLTAFLVLPDGRLFAALRPHMHGARIVLEGDAGGHVLDVTLPPGVYSAATRYGWRPSGGGKAWTYLDRRAVPLRGIVKLTLTDRARASAPRQVKLGVSGKKGAYPVTPADLPLRAIITLGDASDAAAGLCGESSYESTSCAFNQAGSQMVCTR